MKTVQNIGYIIIGLVICFFVGGAMIIWFWFTNPIKLIDNAHQYFHADQFMPFVLTWGLTAFAIRYFLL